MKKDGGKGGESLEDILTGIEKAVLGTGDTTSAKRRKNILTNIHVKVRKRAQAEARCKEPVGRKASREQARK